MALVFTFLLFPSCREQRPQTVIARVGSAELTLEEATSHLDTVQGSFQQSLHRYVSNWVNAELLYQEAKRRGLEDSEQLYRQLSEVKRQLVNQAFLEKFLYSDTVEIHEQTLREYYHEHSSEFLHRDDMIKLNLITFNNRERASSFAAKVSQGMTWETALEKSLDDTSIVSAITNQYYTQHVLFPPELWKVAAALIINEVSFPIKTASGYVVLQPRSKVRRGEQAEFDLVRDEVRQRFLLEKRRQRYEELLGTLRKQYTVEVMIGPMTPSDTTQLQPHE